MISTPDERILAAAKCLSTQPLFVLSTAGQELFHSNFLYWLAKSYPRESRSLFAVLGLASDAYDEVLREAQHIDLTLRSDGRVLVVENKVAAVATVEQLKAYRKKFPKGTATFTLLSLLPVTPAPKHWRLVRYHELVTPLRSASAEVQRRKTVEDADRFDSDLIAHYANLVEGLARLVAAVQPESTDEPFLLNADTLTQLSELRVRPLVEKLRVLYLCDAVQQRAPEAPGHFGINLTNTTGVVDYGVSIPSKRRVKDLVGWQLQGGQFRLMVIVPAQTQLLGPKKRVAREEYVEGHCQDYFQFDQLPGSEMALKPRSWENGKWNGYNPDFVYRYWPVRDTATWAQVTDICAQGTHHADTWAEGNKIKSDSA